MDGVKLRTSTAPDAPEAILPVPDLIRFIDKGWITCEELSIAAVEDKSKANAFNKAVASIQIFWFLCQILGKAKSTVVIFPLEWYTLAYVYCAFFMYAFWWHKPFDVQTPLLVYPDPLLSAEQTIELKRSLPKRSTRRRKRDPLYDLLGFHLTEDFDTIKTGDIVWKNEPERRAVRGRYFATSTVLFGCCHLLARDYPFPTASETYLWRVASISSVCIPLVLLLMAVLDRFVVGLSTGLLGGLLFVLGSMWVHVRLFLLFEVFFALRSAPPEIYKAVPWAQYIPHI